LAAQIDSSDLRIPPEKLEELYQQYREALQRFFRRHRPESVDDLVQTVYVEALSTQPREAVQEPLKYLFGIALNILNNNFQHLQHKHNQFMSVDPKNLKSIPKNTKT